MTYEEIRAEMQSLVKEMLEKCVVRPQAHFAIKDAGREHVSLWSAFDKPGFGGEYLIHAYGDTPEEAIAAAQKIITDLPDPAKEGERRFTKKLAEAVDIATEYALPDAVVDPVRVAIREVNAALLPAP